MLLLLKRRLSHHHHLLHHHLLPPYSSSSSAAAHKTTLIFSSSHHLPTTLPRFSTAATQNPPPKNPFITEYLIDSCGFSSVKAIQASKLLTHINSPSKPDSVLRFLKQIGLTDAHIRNVISLHPGVLRAKVEKTLKPKLRALQEMGFSESELIHLISGNPSALQVCDLRPKITFYRTLFGTNKDILKAITKNNHLLTCSLGRTIMPNISLLRDCAITDAQIGKIILNTPRFITSNPKSIKAAIDRAEELGVPRSSGMFCQMLRSINCISRTTLVAKVKLLKSLGWSEAEILSAIRKFPSLMNISAKKICDTVEFLMNEVGCDLSYVAYRPVLLALSLERRLVPRHCVLRTLKREEFRAGGRDLLYTVSINENKFIEEFILPYKEKVPGLHEAYAATCYGTAAINRKL